MFAAQFIKYRRPLSWVSSGGLGTMGFGIPSSIGAKIGAPEKCVIDIDGDGSFMMTCMEMATAAEFGVATKILLLNNDFQVRAAGAPQSSSGAAGLPGHLEG
jgi:acetolactate synthase-1/2/3 large subunit